MMPAYFVSALANHLWQSTAFAGIAGLLTLALRDNHARTRHWLWLIASVKFLVPFALLTAVGGRLGWLRVARPEFPIVMEQIGQPFAQSPARAAVARTVLAHDASLLPAILLAVWACGSVAVAFSWWRQWRRIRAAVRAGSPVALESDVPVLSSAGMLEPGVFGVFQPVLLLPEGITDRLAPAHLDAIIAHELCHIRRRDNLTAALHMAVEAIFWFHPLVWWLGARLVEERERACDEEVLRLGNQPEVYAESILKTCQFYLESPLVCMSGISGSDLKKRVVRIMTQRAANKLSFGRKLLLAAAGIAAFAGPIVFGLMNAPQVRAQSPAAFSTPLPSFDVASIKPNQSGTNLLRLVADHGRFITYNATLKFLLAYAYHLNDFQISGASGWIESEHYDIEAKRDDPSADGQPILVRDEEGRQLGLMVQSLLADRFKLVLHYETRELPVYALVVAKNGPKLRESPVTPDDLAPPNPAAVMVGPDGPQARHSFRMNGSGELSVIAQSLDRFADLLAHQTGRPVLNKTGLKGDYDFTLKWTPDQGRGQMPGGTPGDVAPPSDANGPTIFTALQEQLGLKLESQKGPVDTLVIDHAERPTEN